VIVGHCEGSRWSLFQAPNLAPKTGEVVTVIVEGSVTVTIRTSAPGQIACAGCCARSSNRPGPQTPPVKSALQLTTGSQRVSDLLTRDADRGLRHYEKSS
jgi:hypothetical protein